MPNALITGSGLRASDVAAAMRDLTGAMDGLTRVLARALREDLVLSYVDFEPTLGFADWKVEMLSLVGPADS